MSEDKVADEAKAIVEITERLRERFPDASPQSVADAVEAARASFSESKVRDFIPVLIERDAKQRLKAARSQ
ncbi:three-helix bundle dimerization domain-containing protein [Microbacterium rhizomatis]|uniref:DUF3562 domain-containing protein n=1 Tax=Microbacterium rhizomatis TaxID=1631477 RepID=A0A5J5J2R1_9MICO|nr:hypothetical protein [Microbacterium rhizomatis]KAA9110172.1 hypothetical protein F6B43_00225 [Microbacterium rhizomatis]